MSYLYPKNNLFYFFTFLIWLISPLLGSMKASAFSERFPMLEPNQGKAEALKNRDFVLTQGNSSLGFNNFPKLKVHLPENQENPAPVPSNLGHLRQKIATNNLLDSLETLDPEITRFNQVMQYAFDAQLTSRPFGEIMQAIAEQFLGSPYVVGLLDRSKQENLVVTLNGFDCVLFIETVLAIARGVAVQDYTYENFRDRIQQQRYRNGQINGYCSRLHYFSDWIDDNQNRNIVRNLTNSLGGTPLNATLNFMTENRQYYHQLSNQENYQCIRNQEAKLANLNIRYIPQHQIATIYPYLQPGDIIATATDIPGLDVTHTGLVYRFPDGNIGFIHASPSGEVKISRDLQSYVQAVDGQIGIIVTRANK